jgi:hypothetical protein
MDQIQVLILVLLGFASAAVLPYAHSTFSERQNTSLLSPTEAKAFTILKILWIILGVILSVLFLDNLLPTG